MRKPVDLTIGKGVGIGPPEWGGKPAEGEAARSRTMAASAMVAVLRIVIENSLAFERINLRRISQLANDFISEY